MCTQPEKKHKKVIRYLRFHTTFVNDLHSMFPFLSFFRKRKFRYTIFPIIIRTYVCGALIFYSLRIHIFFPFLSLFFVIHQKYIWKDFFFSISYIVKSYKGNDESWIFLRLLNKSCFFSFFLFLHDTFHLNECLLL